MPKRARSLTCTGLLLLGLLPALVGCGGGIIGDILPHAVGGYPKDAPPRAGAPGYDEWLKKVHGNPPQEPGQKSVEHPPS